MEAFNNFDIYSTDSSNAFSFNLLLNDNNDDTEALIIAEYLLDEEKEMIFEQVYLDALISSYIMINYSIEFFRSIYHHNLFSLFSRQRRRRSDRMDVVEMYWLQKHPSFT
jgi:hypothetical protein